MPIPVKCTCGASFTLKDEYAGKRLKCPTCSSELLVGSPVAAAAPAAGAPAAPSGVDPVFDRDKFLLRQKHFAISEKYYVNDEAGQPIVYVERPAKLMMHLLATIAAVAVFFVWLGIGFAVSELFPKEVGPFIFMLFFFASVPVVVVVFLAIVPKRHVTFYRDDTMAEPLLDILQDQKIYFPTATFTLRDPRGQTLARFRKNILTDILRKRWNVADPTGREICLAREDSILLSLLRRFLGPLYGVLRTNFIIVRPGDEQLLGEFNRKFTLLDRYVLDLSADRGRTLDRRVALALGVLLDTAEKR